MPDGIERRILISEWGNIGIGFVLAVIGCVFLWFPISRWVSAAVAGLTDLYILFLLLEASQRDTRDPKRIDFPTKFWSVILMFCLLAALVSAFGTMYLKTDNGVQNTITKEYLTCRFDAAYFSTVTITTLGYGDYVPVTAPARKLVLWELGSTVLILIVAFPIVASRLATFGG
jgi:hypothetical protein